MAMFGKESKPCRVYEYGCLKPTAGAVLSAQELMTETIDTVHEI